MQVDPLLGLCGSVLVASSVALSVLSSRFQDAAPPGDRPVLTLVALQLLAGVVHLAAALRVWRAPASTLPAAWLLCVALVVRIVQLPATPILEDDYHRYLWDGALTAHGVNPYRFSPEEVLLGEERIPPTVRELAAESGDLLGKINYPAVRTIYPPVAQAAFALAHRIRPWSMVAWRLVLLACDMATLLVLVRILRACGLPSAWALIYAWHPLLVREIANAGHMDAVVLPFVAGAVLCSIRKRHVSAAGLLGLGVGAKLWPVLLLPLLLRPLLRDPRRFLAAFAAFALLTAALLLPVLRGGVDHSSGFVAYPRAWQCNDGVFRMVLAFAKGILAAADRPQWHAQTTARILTAAVLAGVLAWNVRRPAREGSALCEGALNVVAAAFLLSPAPFPWYYAWPALFVAVRPRGSILLLGALLAIYDVRYHFVARGNEWLFDRCLVWLQHAPVLFLIALEARSHRNRAGAPPRMVVSL